MNINFGKKSSAKDNYIESADFFKQEQVIKYKTEKIF